VPVVHSTPWYEVLSTVHSTGRKICTNFCVLAFDHRNAKIFTLQRFEEGAHNEKECHYSPRTAPV